MTKKIQAIQTKILPILMKYHVKKAGVFGSFALGIDEVNSDVDLLVDIDTQTASHEYFNLKSDLENTLQRSVDVVEYDFIHPVIKQKVLNQEVRIYETS